jgi:hypothetical protein
MRLAANAAVAFPGALAENVQTLARDDLLAKLAFVYPAEAHEAFPTKHRLGVKAGDLRGQLDHQNARKQRPAGDVAGDPEFIGPNVFVSNQPMRCSIKMHDRFEQLHVIAMRIALANLFRPELDLVEVNPRKIKDELWRHSR